MAYRGMSRDPMGEGGGTSDRTSSGSSGPRPRPRQRHEQVRQGPQVPAHETPVKAARTLLKAPVVGLAPLGPPGSAESVWQSPGEEDDERGPH